jgi:hypothetical protein
MAARKRGARRTTGPKKVRIPGTNQWVLPDEIPAPPPTTPVDEMPADFLADVERVIAEAKDGAVWHAEPPDEDDVPPEFAEPVYVNPDLGERPEPEPVVVDTRTYPHYWHAWMPHLTVKRGRKDQVRFKGGIYQPRSATQEANVRKILVKYVPGGDPDRWKGDSRDEDGEVPELTCPECSFTTNNFRVHKDHLQHTQHDKSVRIS